MIHLKTTLRLLLRNKVYSLVNIIGLSLAIGCSCIIYLYVLHELNYERHLDNLENTYRVVGHYDSNGEIVKRSGSMYPMADVLRNDFAEIEKTCHIQYSSNPVLKVELDGKYSPPRTHDISYAYVEPDYSDIFSVKWLKGDPGSALQNPGSVVLTSTFTRALFGDSEDVIGRKIDLNYGSILSVTGVVEDPPASSEFDMGMLISFNSLAGHQDEYDSQDWRFSMGTLQAYVQLNENLTDIKLLEEKLNGIQEKYIKQEWASDMEFVLQPLSDMHYNPEYQVFQKPAITKRYIWILGFVGIFLFLIACINYVNLSTAFAIKNQKGAGIRKALGCSRMQILIRAITESSIITIIAMSLGLYVSYWLLSLLKNQVGLEPAINLNFDSSLVIFIAGILFISGIFSGIYPAVLQIKTNAISAMRNSLSSSSKGVWTRRSLVIVQFAIAQTLIIAIIMLIRQMDFVENQSLGFDEDSIVVVPLPENDQATLKQLRDRLSKYPELLNVTFAVAPPTDYSYWYVDNDYFKDETNRKVGSHVKFVDEHYLKTYDLQLLAGTDFIQSDTLKQIVINEEFVREMGLTSAEEAIGERIGMYGGQMLVVGVVRNFHAESLHKQIPPVVMWKSEYYLQTAGIKINSVNTQQSLTHIQREWEAMFPDKEYGYSFLNETIRNFYSADRNKSVLLNLFAWVSIFIACLGIYGLVSFLTAQKVKEIGIRKVLGASVLQLLTLFSKEFVILVLSALIISIPIGYFVVSNWLEDFPYRVETSPFVFGLAGIVSIVIALSTVSFQSWRAARADPVDSLRTE